MLMCLNTWFLAGGTTFESHGTFKRWRLVIGNRSWVQPGGFEVQCHFLPRLLLDWDTTSCCHSFFIIVLVTSFVAVIKYHDQKQLKKKFMLA